MGLVRKVTVSLWLVACGIKCSSAWRGDSPLSRSSLELCAHPADDLQHHPGAGLLEHGHSVTVGDTLQAVAIHSQQPAMIKILII